MLPSLKRCGRRLNVDGLGDAARASTNIKFIQYVMNLLVNGTDNVFNGSAIFNFLATL